MGARAQLLSVADKMAEKALQDVEADLKPEIVGATAAAAKTALEAAALAENVSAGEVDLALDAIQGLLAEAGVLDEWMEHDVPTFLDRTFRALLAWRQEALRAQGYEVAYGRVRDLLDGLVRDWVAADSEVSRRLAARARTALDDATEIIKQSTKGVGDGEQTG